MYYLIFIIIYIAAAYYFNTDGWSVTTSKAVTIAITGGATALIFLGVIEILKSLYRFLFGDESNIENKYTEGIKPSPSVRMKIKLKRLGDWILGFLLFSVFFSLFFYLLGFEWAEYYLTNLVTTYYGWCLLIVIFVPLRSLYRWMVGKEDI